MDFMKVVKGLDLGHGEELGLLGEALDAGVGYGAGYGLGRICHRLGDKHPNAARRVPWLAAAVGKGVAAVVEIATGGAGGGAASLMKGAFNSVGQAGLVTAGVEAGVRHEMESRGEVLMLYPKGTDKAKMLAGGREVRTGLGEGQGRLDTVDSVGALPRARGRVPSLAEIERLAAMH